MINWKSKTAKIILTKIFLIATIVYSIQSNIDPTNRLMTADELTSVGLNSFYFLINNQIHTQPFKVVLLSALVFSCYLISLSKINNFYEGLKETIRIRSQNLHDYFKKSAHFLLKPLFIDIMTSITIIFITMLIIQVENVLSVMTIRHLLLMGVFYLIIPFLLLFLVNRIEFFLVGIFTLSIFADYFVYKLPLYGIAGLYLLTIATAYGIILFKERKA